MGKKSIKERSKIHLRNQPEKPNGPCHDYCGEERLVFLFNAELPDYLSENDRMRCLENAGGDAKNLLSIELSWAWVFRGKSKLDSIPFNHLLIFPATGQAVSSMPNDGTDILFQIWCNKLNGTALLTQLVRDMAQQAMKMKLWCGGNQVLTAAPPFKFNDYMPLKRPCGLTLENFALVESNAPCRFKAAKDLWDTNPAFYATQKKSGVNMAKWGK